MPQDQDSGSRGSMSGPIPGDRPTIFREQLISLTQAARMLPPVHRGRRAHVATLYRWAQHGLKGHVLETIQIGGTRCTSAEALERFFVALSESSRTVKILSSRERDEKERMRRLDEALTRAGI